jgi:hypothetical protein
MGSMATKQGQPSRVKLALGALRATKHVTPAQLPHWSEHAVSADLQQVRAALQNLLADTSGPPQKKGQPHTSHIKRELARELDAQLARAAAVDATTLELAHRLVAVDMSAAHTFDAYVGLIEIANAAALRQARESLARNVVMHLSCVPRIVRAEASCASFAGVPDVSQVIVVGSASAHTYQFDVHTRILTVPAGDTYEHLPAKVFAAMFFFALCRNIETVLKVDDDHRLADRRRLADYFEDARVETPLQIGSLNNIGVLGNHARVWHFGKCADGSLNAKPFTLPGTTRWINGANGYFVNRAALRLLFWSQIYFPDYIRLGLYEDMTVSDLLERQGARLIKADMARILKTVDQY